MYRLSLTSADGTVLVTRDVQRMPRTWKSWLMHQVPYGTPLQGCTFGREQVADPRVLAATDHIGRGRRDV